MKLDRGLQKELLTKLADAYPGHAQLATTYTQEPEAEAKYIANMLYLEAHGLVNAGLKRNLSGQYTSMPPSITARGLDFLADDGGLSAILGTVTIKIHDDTIRDLITMKIAASDIPEEEKGPLVESIKELPGEAVKHVAMSLIDAGLENLRAALPAIRVIVATAIS